jgi:methionine-gamma-lyase
MCYLSTQVPWGGYDLVGDSTRSVHEAEYYDQQTGSLTTPIYETSIFGFTKAEEVLGAVAGERGYVYSRWDNPTIVRLEKKLATNQMKGLGGCLVSK